MPTEDRSGQDDHERRLAALRSLAEQASQAAEPAARARPGDAPAPSAPLRVALASRPHRGRHRLLIALAAALIVALIAGVWAVKGGLLSGKPSAATTLPDTGTIDLTKFGLHCPSQPTWSPDGKRIAIFVTEGDCSGGQSVPWAIAVVDARTGALVRHISLYRLLAAQGFASSFSSLFAWTPDSASLVFSVNFSPFQALPPGAKHGLVIVSVTSGAAKVFLDAAPVPHLTMANTLIWDTQTGKLAHVIAELPYAASYTWGVDGALAPSPSGKGGKGAVGFWQAGTITPVIPQIPAGTPIPSNSPLLKPPAFYYTSTTPQWSPDDRYVALPLTLGARLPGGASPHALETGASCPDLLTLACQSPTAVSSPDAGFNAVLSAAEAGWTQPQAQSTVWNSEDVAWRADGQEVATMLPGQGFDASQSTVRVTIFSARTGAKARTLTAKRVVVNFSGGGPAVVWSPIGSSLALVNVGDGTLTIWRNA